MDKTKEKDVYYERVLDKGINDQTIVKNIIQEGDEILNQIEKNQEGARLRTFWNFIKITLVVLLVVQTIIAIVEGIVLKIIGLIKLKVI